MRAMEENIEQQLRPPYLLLKLLEEPHLDGACSTNLCEPNQGLNVDQRRYRRVDAVVDE
jgi:hypothetical protein